MTDKKLRFKYFGYNDGKCKFHHIRWPDSDVASGKRSKYSFEPDGVADKYHDLLYNWKAVQPDSDVYWTEGERDADALTSAGAVAVSHWQGGASSRPEQAEWLVERMADGTGIVWVLADRDEVGYACAYRRREHLLAAGLPEARIRLRVAGAGKDVRDHLEADLGLEELLPVGVPELAAAAASYRANPDRAKGSDGWGEPWSLEDSRAWAERTARNSASANRKREIRARRAGTKSGGRVSPAKVEASQDGTLPSLTRRMSEVPTKPLRWVWPGRIPRGKLTVLDGDPSLGKSVLTLDIAARVSAGRAMPGRGTGRSPRSVLLVLAEDDLGDTVRPRLESASADLDRVHFITVQRDPDGKIIPLSIPDDLDLLRGAIRETSSALVVIDPITAYLSERVQSHNDASVRKALSPLKEVAEETGAAIVLVRHLNKSGEGKAMYRGGGSIAFTGAARSGLIVEQLPDDPEFRALAQVKSNLARNVRTITYRVCSSEELGRPGDYDMPVVEWGEESDLTADQLFARPDARRNAPARDAAIAFLNEVLREGPRSKSEIDELAKVADVAPKSLKSASEVMGIVKTPVRQDGVIAGWGWSLPAGVKFMSDG